VALKHGLVNAGAAQARRSWWLTRAEPVSANAGSGRAVAGARAGAVRASGVEQERGGAGGAAWPVPEQEQYELVV
jgi:hypothetical protein